MNKLWNFSGIKHTASDILNLFLGGRACFLIAHLLCQCSFHFGFATKLVIMTRTWNLAIKYRKICNGILFATVETSKLEKAYHSQFRFTLLLLLLIQTFKHCGIFCFIIHYLSYSVSVHKKFKKKNFKEKFQCSFFNR